MKLGQFGAVRETCPSLIFLRACAWASATGGAIVPQSSSAPTNRIAFIMSSPKVGSLRLVWGDVSPHRNGRKGVLAMARTLFGAHAKCCNAQRRRRADVRGNNVQGAAQFRMR